MALNAGTVTVGIKVVDGKSLVTAYVERSAHVDLRKRLREAQAEAAEWEERYWDLLAQHGGTA